MNGDDVDRAERRALSVPTTSTGSRGALFPAEFVDEPTLWTCPDHPTKGGTHHLIPRAAGQTCQYCKTTEKTLRDQQREAVENWRTR